MAYGHAMLLLERAGSVDRRRVAEQVRALDLRDGPALLFPGRHVKYDEAGGGWDAKLMIMQSQNGRIVTTDPAQDGGGADDLAETVAGRQRADACRLPDTRLCGGAKVAERLHRPWHSMFPASQVRRPTH
jgi:hypothetical protein